MNSILSLRMSVKQRRDMDFILFFALNYPFNMVLCDSKSGSQILRFCRPIKKKKKKQSKIKLVVAMTWINIFCAE